MPAILDRYQIVPDGGPQDLNGAAFTGDWINLTNAGCVTYVVHYSDGTATTGDLDISLDQATNNAGASSKALAVIDTIYRKTDPSSTTALDHWAKVTQTISASMAGAAAGEDIGVFAFEVAASSLDSAGGFSHVQLTIDATTSAKTVSVLALVGPMVSATGPEYLRSAID